MDKTFRVSTHFQVWIVAVSLCMGLFWIAPVVAGTPPDWYRIRTGSVPHQPDNIVIDVQGRWWVTAMDGTEDDPVLWCHAPEDPDGTFHLLTNSSANNYPLKELSLLVEKPEFTANVRYAVKDSRNNTWYSLKNRQVICEKSDGGQQIFDMPNTEYLGSSDTINVDSAHRIRLINDTPDGSRKTLLIAARSIVLLDSSLNVEQTREVFTTYNNDFINDALIDTQGRYWILTNRGVEKGTSRWTLRQVWAAQSG
ncbi:hypothetical protein [Desulfobacula sp.]|uniref:hypothetical protein n=1 Tax=Desulfobacula sp. TaxID=2593537 RepID=UPI002624AD69|nr:hypothetical protein [Desulfobacula sp.]